MARTLFFIEAILLILASTLFSVFGSRPLSTFLVPVSMSLLIPLFSVSAIWSPSSVLRAFTQAFSPGRPGLGGGESAAILAALSGFIGLGAASGFIGAAIVVAASLSKGSSPREATFQAMAFALFGLLSAIAATILRSVLSGARTPPENGDIRIGLAACGGKYGLSPRELEVAAGLVGGKSYRAIAEGLFISEKTVKTHASQVYSKTGCPNKVALILLLRAETSDSYERPMVKQAERVDGKGTDRPQEQVGGGSS